MGFEWILMGFNGIWMGFKPDKLSKTGIWNLISMIKWLKNTWFNWDSNEIGMELNLQNMIKTGDLLQMVSYASFMGE